MSSKCSPVMAVTVLQNAITPGFGKFLPVLSVLSSTCWGHHGGDWQCSTAPHSVFRGRV